MIKLPTDLNSKWSQPNNSDKFGSLWATKNINLDEEGYIKLSPKAVTLYSEDDDAQLDVAVAIRRYADGSYHLVTQDHTFTVVPLRTGRGVTESSDGTAPSCASESHGCFFNNLWHASTNTAVLSKAIDGGASAAWTSQIAGLADNMRHYMAEFANRRTLCVTNGNVVKQYTTSSYGASVDLTIPLHLEAIGLAYNNAHMGVITRIGTGTILPDIESFFFYWDGSTTEASGFGLGTDNAISVVPYQNTFAVLTRAGKLMRFNGGGFDELASLPFYFDDKTWDASGNFLGQGDTMTVDGDVIYLNLELTLDAFGRRGETQMTNALSGVWCYDPKIGLYHRWSPSITPAYVHDITTANINTSTDVFTTNDTIPATGGIMRYFGNGTGTSTIDELKLNEDYYVIKASSTTFKLATTRANALANVAIDIITVTAATTTYFWAFDYKDYGASIVAVAGAIGKTNQVTQVFRDILLGGQLYNTSLTGKDSLCIVVPRLDNRGYFITPKIFSSQVKDNNQKLFVRFRPLKTNDSIIIKYRTRDVVGLPVLSPNGAATDEAIWTSPSEFYTTTDLSEAKTYLDAGGELECELLAGAGGGQLVKVTSIENSGSTYNLVLAEEVVGAASTLKSYFQIMNWEVKRTITSTDSDHDSGVAEIPIGGASKFIQFKVEMRGSDVTIEEIGFVGNVNKQAV